MSSYNLEIPGLFAVGAPTQRELDSLIDLALAIRKAHKDDITPTPEQSIAPSPRVNQPKVASNAREEQWKEASGEGRMRMTREEKAEYNDNREDCARARLIAMGLEPCEGDANGGESEGVTWNGSIDPGFVPED